MYPAIDVVFYGNQGELEYISSSHREGIQQISLSGLSIHTSPLVSNAEGNLLLRIAEETTLRFQRPLIYQESSGQRASISAHYILSEQESLDSDRLMQQVGFVVGPHHTEKPLVIDPVLSFSAPSGDRQNDYVNDIAVDAAGNIYVTGHTESSNLPTTAQTVQLTTDRRTPNYRDTFVAKFDPEKSALAYATYLGGSLSEEGHEIAVDAVGNAYVTWKITMPRTGVFFSTGGGTSQFFTGHLDFNPSESSKATTPPFIDSPLVNPLQGIIGGESDAFVAQVVTIGSRLLFSTFLAGETRDTVSSIAVDSEGNIYVAGNTDPATFPKKNFLPGITRREPWEEAFVAKIKTSDR